MVKKITKMCPNRTGHLKTHINAVHNGQKDHKCGPCGKTFSLAGNLRRHFNLVHNVKT